MSWASGRGRSLARTIELLAFAAAILTIGPLRVSAETWTNVYGGDWLTAANWGGTVPNGVGATATISTLPTEYGDFTLYGSMTLSNLFYSNFLERRIYGTGPLTLAVTSGVPEISVTDGALYILPTISGSQGLKKSGGNKLTLEGYNSYLGTTSVDGGTLIGYSIANYGSNSSFGRGNFSLSNGGILEYNGSDASTDRTVELGTGGGAVSVAYSKLTMANGITGPGSLTKAGNGTLILTAANSYEGGTTINAGLVLVNNTTGSATGSGSVTVNNLAWLGGTGAIAGPVTINSGARFFVGANIGALAVNNDLTLASGSTFYYQTNANAPTAFSRADLLNVQGGLNMHSGAKIDYTNSAGTLIAPNTKLTVASYSGSWNGGHFAGHQDDKVSFFQGQGFKVDYNDTTGGANQGGGAHGNFVTLTATSLDGRAVVAGSPGLGGYGVRSHASLNNSGVAVATVQGNRAVRWDGSGTAATELGTLGTGGAEAYAFAVNNVGTAVGISHKVVANVNKGNRAVRWDASGTTATELGALGTDAGGSTHAVAYALNSAGIAVGYSNKYVSGAEKGTRAVRWDPSGTAAIELGNLGTDTSGNAYGTAFAINDSGTVVGQSAKFVSGDGQGFRAVRWDSTGTPTELGVIAAHVGQFPDIAATAVNNSGTAVGRSMAGNGEFPDIRPIRWNASGTVATELEILGFADVDVVQADALAINNAGTAVGYSSKSDSGTQLGYRAVRWNASGSAATELANLGTLNGYTYSQAYAVNDSDTAVGTANKYVSGEYEYKPHAVIWLPDTSVLDLNDLGVVATPGDGSWTLTTAKAISADGWVAGTGTFAPNVGDPYERHWVTQVGLGGEWTDDFTSTLNGTWGRGRQWSTGTPAMQVGDATFNANSSCTVSLDRNETTRSVKIEAGNVTLDLNGYTLNSLVGSRVFNGARLSAAGTIIGELSNAGTLAPGTSIGELTIDGVMENTGTIDFELNGGAAGEFDRLIVDDFKAGGVLKVILGYTPTLPESFDLVHFATFIDQGYTFDFAQAPLPGNLQWDTSDFEVAGVISVILPGDYNFDGAVGAADYVGWRKDNGTQVDYNTWRANFGRTTDSDSGNITNAAVPEPTTLLMLLAGILTMIAHRHKLIA